MPHPLLRLSALLSLLTVPASAASLIDPLSDFSSARLLAASPHIELQRSPVPVAGAFVYAFARGGERARDLAAAYGVDPQDLTVNVNAPLPRGAVLKLPVSGALAGRLPPGVLRTVVRPGDTVERLARRFDLSTADLLSANLDLQSLDRLAVGQELLIPTRARGLLVRLKSGQSLPDLLRSYRADPVQVVRVNDLDELPLPRTGDYVLLPGLRARGLMTELLARRERARINAIKREQLARYQDYLAFTQEKKRRALQAAYKRQAAYDQYQAYLQSPQRQALQARYARQAQYDKFLAQQAKAREAVTLPRARQAPQPGGAAPLGTPTLRRASFGDTGIIWPMQHYQITSRFGERDIAFHQQHFHGGVDLAAPTGTPIYAATDGVVAQAGYGDFGLNVWMTEGDATVIYGHMSRLSVGVGQRVRQGSVIGFVGCTGFCTGPHLHFEVRLAGQAVNPLGLLP